MEIDPNLVLDKGIETLKSNLVLINKVIEEFESREFSIYKGIRTTLPVSAFPSLEMEIQGNDSSWYATRVQRHTMSFRCVITITAPTVEDRETYQNRLTSAVASIFKNPQNMRFAIPCVEGQYRYEAYVYDSFVSDTSYGSTKDGQFGVSEFSWTVNIHERIPDILFNLVPGQVPNIMSPDIKEIRND